MADHSPEPWREELAMNEPLSAHGTDATARRVMACLAACAGIGTEWLEGSAKVGSLFTWSEDSHRLAEAERLLRDLLLEMGGVGIHNSATANDAMEFLGVANYPELEAKP